MVKLLKAGILTAVLVVPALIFLYLRAFGENQYTLRRYYPLTDSTEQVLLKANPAARFFEPKEDTVFHVIPPFQLVNQDGKETTETALRGKIHVADFFFSRCESICPKLSAQLSRVQEVFSVNPAIQLVSYTVDPDHDTPDVLRRYASEYDARPGKWLFLTGNKTQLYHLAQKGYFVPVLAEGDGNEKPNETFTHSEKLVLVDKAGIIRGYYDGTDKKEVDRLILEIRVLLEIYEKQKS
ncbi:MAG: SCO family protein [Sphingobacteriaceae bacterium]|nr:SCO family protein [Cytophagaceae bacterium]